MTFKSPADYRPPEANATVDDKIGWLKEIRQEGDNYLRQQPAYPDIAKGREMIRGLTADEEMIPEKLSRVRVPRTKRQMREIVATLSNLRPMWDYGSGSEELYEDQALALNKLQRAWYYSTFADRDIRQALQYAAVEGTGYLHIGWERNFLGIAGQGEIRMRARGADSVMPVGMGDDFDLQTTDIVTTKAEVPISKAWAIYPEFASALIPDRDAGSWARKGWDNVVGLFRTAFLNVSSATARKKQGLQPTLDIYSTYIDDPAVNLSDHYIPMGDPGTSWYYEVPPIGAEIPTGFYNPDGRPKTRAATYEDCRIYPGKRLIIWTNSVVLRDGPNFYWHGRCPVVQFRFDDWPWLFLGFSLARDVWRIEESNDQAFRLIDDSGNCRLNPAMGYSEEMSEEFKENFNPRIPGQRVRKPNMADKPVEPLLNPAYYDVPMWYSQHLKDMEERQDFIMGIPSIKELLSLKQMPQGDTVEKILEAAGPIVTDICRNMERSLRDLGMIWMPDAFQFYSAPRRMQLIGEDGITPQDFDFEPGDMIPSHMRGEDTERPSNFTRLERARAHVNSFSLRVTPNSMTQITQVMRKMFLLQLWRDPKDFPLSPWTLAEAFDIPNFGPPPEGTKNEMERWMAWKKMQMEMAADAQEIIGKLPGQGGRQGRPPSGGSPPEIVSKDNGTRQTVQESGG